MPENEPVSLEQVLACYVLLTPQQRRAWLSDGLQRLASSSSAPPARASQAPAAGQDEGIRDKASLGRYFGVSHRTVQGWVADGCPHIRIGRVLRFELGPVRAWLTTHGDAPPTPRSLRARR